MNQPAKCLFGGALVAAGLACTDASAQSFTHAGGVDSNAYAYDYAFGYYQYAYTGQNPIFDAAGGFAFTGPDGSTASTAWDTDAGTWSTTAVQAPGVTPPAAYVAGDLVSDFAVAEAYDLTVTWDFATVETTNTRNRVFWYLYDTTDGNLTLLDGYDAIFPLGSAAESQGPAASLTYTLDPTKTYTLHLNTNIRSFTDGATTPSSATVDASLSAAPACPADLNGDGFLNNTDANLFVQAFLAQQAQADFNGDGFWNNADVNLFVQSFLQGCS